MRPWFGRHLPRSVELYSAVSPNCIRQTWRHGRARRGWRTAMQVTNLRYSRLQICATGRAIICSLSHGLHSKAVRNREHRHKMKNGFPTLSGCGDSRKPEARLCWPSLRKTAAGCAPAKRLSGTGNEIRRRLKYPGPARLSTRERLKRQRQRHPLPTKRNPPSGAPRHPKRCRGPDEPCAPEALLKTWPGPPGSRRGPAAKPYCKWTRRGTALESRPGPRAGGPRRRTR